MNEISFAGNAGKDAEFKYVGNNNTPVCQFSLCYTEKPKDKDPVSTWVLAKVWGKQAEFASEIKKGDNVFVKGKLGINTWSGKDGVERTSVEIFVHSLGIIKRNTQPATAQAKAKTQTAYEPGFDEFQDIPF